MKYKFVLILAIFLACDDSVDYVDQIALNICDEIKPLIEEIESISIAGIQGIDIDKTQIGYYKSHEDIETLKKGLTTNIKNVVQKCQFSNSEQKRILKCLEMESASKNECNQTIGKLMKEVVNVLHQYSSKVNQFILSDIISKNQLFESVHDLDCSNIKEGDFYTFALGSSEDTIHFSNVEYMQIEIANNSLETYSMNWPSNCVYELIKETDFGNLSQTFSIFYVDEEKFKFVTYDQGNPTNIREAYIKIPKH